MQLVLLRWLLLFSLLFVGSIDGAPFSRSWHQVVTSSTRAESQKVVDNTYEVVRFIDQGRYSMVFDAVHGVSDQPVVLKVLKSGRLDKLSKEIEILEKLRGSAGIIRLLNASNSTRFNYLVFESIGAEHRALCHGSGRALSASEVKLYIRLLLQAVKSCHSHKIMHRDIKPKNIVVNTATETLRLLDFGLR